MYRQLADAITALISNAVIAAGDRLPPTRELAGQLRINRTTVSAAYSLLEENGRLEGQVGRGSFVAVPSGSQAPRFTRDWEAILPPVEIAWQAPSQPVEISFASSRPAHDEFPLSEFRRLAKEVIDSPEAIQILQLGSSRGYAPLRRFLWDEALRSGIARPSDDLLITNGCQQALDLLARLFAAPGSTVVLEDPVYHGMLRVFARTGAEIVGIGVDEAGIDPDVLESCLMRHRPSLLIVTPSFQNPTGSTLSIERRKRIVAMAERFGCVLVEIDLYSELRYAGTALPALKTLDGTGNTILLRSYSKVAFPGLRVGWVVAPQPVIARLAEAKEISDLHSDQLSQAVLLRFAESGGLRRHLERTCRTGADRLEAVLEACERFLPKGARYTRPDGGMSLWIELPAPITAEALLPHAEQRGVTFLIGKHFSTHRPHARALRICFGGLRPEQIARGIGIIGETAERLNAIATRERARKFEPAAALV